MSHRRELTRKIRMAMSFSIILNLLLVWKKNAKYIKLHARKSSGLSVSLRHKRMESSALVCSLHYSPKWTNFVHHKSCVRKSYTRLLTGEHIHGMLIIESRRKKKLVGKTELTLISEGTILMIPPALSCETMGSGSSFYDCFGQVVQTLPYCLLLGSSLSLHFRWSLNSKLRESSWMAQLHSPPQTSPQIGYSKKFRINHDQRTRNF